MVLLLLDITYTGQPLIVYWLVAFTFPLSILDKQSVTIVTVPRNRTSIIQCF